MVGMPFGTRCTADLPKTDSLTGSVFEANPLSPPPHDNPPTPPPYTTVLLLLLLIPLSCLHACTLAFRPLRPGKSQPRLTALTGVTCRACTRALCCTHTHAPAQCCCYGSRSRLRFLTLALFPSAAWFFSRTRKKTTLTNLNWTSSRNDIDTCRLANFRHSRFFKRFNSHNRKSCIHSYHSFPPKTSELALLDAHHQEMANARIASWEWCPVMEKICSHCQLSHNLNVSNNHSLTSITSIELHFAKLIKDEEFFAWK